MTETDFNALMRAVFRVQGLRSYHIREADTTGLSDLIVYEGAHILAWAELKLENRPLEISQTQWLPEQDALSHNCFVIEHLDGPAARLKRPADGGKDWTRLDTCAMIRDVRTADWRYLFRQYTKQA